MSLGAGWVAPSRAPTPSPPRGEALLEPLLLIQTREHLASSVKKCHVGGLFALALSVNKQAWDPR